MIPHIFKRCAANKTPRQGRKGHLFVTPKEHPPIKPEEELKIVQRRIEKAERDERMDITSALTPPKTYMGGFTRPRDLRSVMWFPGGPYDARAKKYEPPPQAAYVPHTIFLLESRYPVKFGIGRVDAYDHVNGCCLEGNLEGVLRRFNSLGAPSDQIMSMDNARWPWTPQKREKRIKWWTKDENPMDIIKEIHEGVDSSYNDPTQFVEEDADEDPTTEDPTLIQRVRDPVRLKLLMREVESQEEESPPVVPSAELPTDPPDSEQGTSPLLVATGADQADLEPSADTPVEVAAGTTPDSNESIKAEAGPQISSHHKAKNQASPTPPDNRIIRSRYLPTLAETPFWRPLLTVTVSTRPIALTILRLCKALERGLPYYSSIPSEDRKSRHSFSSRVRCLRLNRYTELVLRTAEALAGVRGGFIGVRFDANQRGRGVNGDSLADPIPWEKRVIGIGVGNWYARAQEVKEVFRMAIDDRLGAYLGKDAQNPFEIYGLDDFGRRIDDETGEVIPWPQPTHIQLSPIVSQMRLYKAQLAGDPEPQHGKKPYFAKGEATVKEVTRVAKEVVVEDMQRRVALKRQRRELAEQHGRTIAAELAQLSKKVMQP